MDTGQANQRLETMFTGLIEHVGTLEKRSRIGSAGQIEIDVQSWAKPFTIGESIAVEGVCLTLTQRDQSRLMFDILEETFHKTTLGNLPVGAQVNLERALSASGRLGGHIMNGHVDGVGKVASFQQEGRDWVLEITCGREILEEMVTKGCMAVNGVSLTVTDLTPESFRIHLIPETMKRTSLHQLGTESLVNLETDIIGKYIRRCLESGHVPPSITWEQLRTVGLESI